MNQINQFHYLGGITALPTIGRVKANWPQCDRGKLLTDKAIDKYRLAGKYGMIEQAKARLSLMEKNTKKQTIKAKTQLKKKLLNYYK